MIFYTNNDIFKMDVEAIVNPVNCYGVMGKGLALEFKKRYPKNFEEYRDACSGNRIDIGKVLGVYENNKHVINLPTKFHWKNKSELVYVEKGLTDLKRYLIKNNIKSVAIPKLGCGLGGLDWRDVRKLIENKFANLEYQIDVYVLGE